MRRCKASSSVRLCRPAGGSSKGHAATWEHCVVFGECCGWSCGAASCHVSCRCVVLRRIVFGRVVSYGRMVVVLCRGVFCVLLCGVGWCRVVLGHVMSRCVLFCGGLLCDVVLCCVVWCCVVVRWVVVFLVL